MIKKRLMRGLTLLPASVGLMFAANSVQATTATSTFTVTATVAASCTVAATSLAFGNFTLTQLDGTSTITLTCTNGTSYTVGLDAGTSPSATTVARKMTGPTVGSTVQYLSYALYSDPGRTTNWGATSASWVSGTGTGSAVPITVYGRIPASTANQTASIGSYSDTITVTVTY